jgi:hypothetical protein
MSAAGITTFKLKKGGAAAEQPAILRELESRSPRSIALGRT